MKKTLLFFILLLPLLFLPLSSVHLSRMTEKRGTIVSTNQGGVRRLHPIYVRLQALENGSIILWECIPQSFQDHVATIDLSVLAIFVSHNARTINFSRDEVGNLWMAVNYTFNEGGYISSLIWASSETLSQNLSIPDFVPFPESYPEDVMPFLNSGIKMPVENETIKEIARANNNTRNMVETVLNVLDFTNKTQEYDAEKTRLLMTGDLNVTNLMDFFKGPLETLETGESFCFERALLAAAILRAAGVPTRTFTDTGPKTWIQVWLPQIGWVDAEALCVQPTFRFPLPLTSTMPWMVENSSDAIFPFEWVPEIRMRVANLTFSDVETFNVYEHPTVLVEPIDSEVFEQNPDAFRFPIAFKPEVVYAAITREGENLNVTLMDEKDKEKKSKLLVLGDSNRIVLSDTALSFEPILLEDFVLLQDFSVQKTWEFDLRVLIPIVGVPVAILVVWLYRRRTQH